MSDAAKRERKRKYDRERYAANREDVLASRKATYTKYRANYTEQMRRYYVANKSAINRRARKYREANREKTMLRAARKRAEAKGLEFTITIGDIIIPLACPVLGILLETGVRICTDSSPALDRVTNSLGYVPGNVRVISQRANRIKNDATLQEIEAVRRYMLGHEGYGQ